MARDKAIDSAKLDGALTATADAIRSVKDSTDPIEWNEDTGFADALSDISTGLPTQEKTITITENGTVEVTPDEGYALSKVTANAQVYEGGADPRVKQLVEGTLTSFSDDTITKLGAYAFYYCEKLTEVHLPNMTEISNGAFGHTNLKEVSFPYVTRIYQDAFSYCSSLSNVSFPALTEIQSSAFYYCSNLKMIDLPELTRLYSGGSIGEYFQNCGLTTVHFPKLTRIYGNNAFAHCKSLVDVNLPLLTQSASYAFTGCIELISANLPSIQSVGMQFFKGCTKLTDVNIPNATEIGSSTFSQCQSLEKLDLPMLSKLNSSTFEKCTLLTLLILRTADAPCTLSNKSAFTGTPFYTGGTGGICLVPRALIESYQTATNWSTLYAAGTCLFWALEDYTINGTITGEIDWDKLNADREGAFATE